MIGSDARQCMLKSEGWGSTLFFWSVGGTKDEANPIGRGEGLHHRITLACRRRSQRALQHLL